MARKWEHYIVDGYNVINSWPELIKLQDDLSKARDELVHILTEYGAYEKYDIVEESVDTWVHIAKVLN